MATMTGEPGPVPAAVQPRVEVPITVADPAWKGRGEVRAIVRKAALAAMRECAEIDSEICRPGNSGPMEISVLLTGDAGIRALNRDYREVDSATNVLAFASGAPAPAEGAPRLLGDVVLAYGTVSREAEATGIAFSHHLAHLVVHGVLHLLGYDHVAAADAETMERAEVRILATLGIGDPYRGIRPAIVSGAATTER